MPGVPVTDLTSSFGFVVASTVLGFLWLAFAKKLDTPAEPSLAARIRKLREQ